jgi:type I restriction enzyme, S subunit
MDSWREQTLAQAGVELIDCVHKTPPKCEAGMPYVAIPEMRGGGLDLASARKISEEDFEQWTKKAKPKAFDVVLSRRCNPGETAFVRPGMQFALGQNLVLLRANGEQVHPPFLRWLARSPQWWEQVETFLNVGAVFDSLRCADVPKFRLPVPPKNEQLAISTLLGALDDKIELNRQTNETLEALARAIFKDWFVDFGPTRAKAEGRAAYLAPALSDLFPDRLDAEGKPEGWEPRRVDQLLELAYGKSLPAKKRLPGPYRVYGSGGLAGYHNSALTAQPTIVVGRKGTVGSLYWEDEPCFPIDTVFFVKPRVPLTFCFYLLETLGLERMNTDAAVPGLNRNNVYRLTVSWPGEPAVSMFAEHAEAIRGKIRGNLEESQTLAQTRDLLLPKLMSGEVRLRDAEQALRY